MTEACREKASPMIRNYANRLRVKITQVINVLECADDTFWRMVTALEGTGATRPDEEDIAGPMCKEMWQDKVKHWCHVADRLEALAAATEGLEGIAEEALWTMAAEYRPVCDNWR